MVDWKKLLRRREATYEGYGPYDLVVRLELEDDPAFKDYLIYRSDSRADDMISRLKAVAVKAELKRALKEEGR